jgi:hypothetical protein
MDAGRSRVSVRRTVQALSGFAIRQRPRVGSRAVIPARIYLLDAARGLGETHFLERFGRARSHAVRPRTVRTIQINKQAPMNPAIR